MEKFPVKTKPSLNSAFVVVQCLKFARELFFFSLGIICSF